MLLKACLNGSRPAGFHPALPLTAEALAADAAKVAAAGAAAVHIHPRRAGDLAESLSAEAIEPCVAAIRARCPGLPIGVSTREGIERDDARQLALIGGWRQPPDFASVNLGERNALAVIEALLGLGVPVEAGLATPGDVDILLGSGFAPRCLRLMVEIDDLPVAQALATARAVLDRLAAGGLPGPHLVHGFERSVWPVFDLAVALGHGSRLGLEDSPLLPDGQIAPGNAALIGAGLARRAARG